MDNEQTSLSFDKHVNALPAETLGLSIRKLSVIDRLRCERVSPRWRWLVEKLGWTEQRKLDRETVFEVTNDKESSDHFIRRFWENRAKETTGEGSRCENLFLLFRRVSQNLKELDLTSFGPQKLQSLLPQLSESLKLFPKLEHLCIEHFDFMAFWDYLPETLRVLCFSGTISDRTRKALYIRCPKLSVMVREIS